MKAEGFAKLYTKQGEAVSDMPWSVYPRPRLVRDSFFCLNGEWELTDTFGEKYSITVPFPPESLLSGVGKRMGEKPNLVYKKIFSLPNGFVRDRVILHFGAVDQIAEIVLNGALIGTHVGGYEHFSFDITDLLKVENVLTVTVTNADDPLSLPYGKQRERRGGMWYTPVTGIWQTVWLESVPTEYIRSIDMEYNGASVTVTAEGINEGVMTVQTPNGEISTELCEGRACVCIDSARLWSPEDPYLYRFKICAKEDEVSSYFAFRTVSIEDYNGKPRICLNGKPIFLNGILDQGYYSDGLFTPASPECYKNDILTMKELGFNMLRKHIKIEPDIFYYYCDLYGMTVVQDMVNNGRYSFLRDTALPTVGFKKRTDLRMHRDASTRKAFEACMTYTVHTLKRYPSIVGWTVFNEGWGQFCSEDMYMRLRELDGSRFIDTASGWFSGSVSDVESIHVYFKPIDLPKNSDKPIFLSEFGGYSYKPKGHAFNLRKTYGYRFFSKRDEFEDALCKLYTDELIPAIYEGLCGCVYTQLSDVEDETNGLLSYDRKVQKVDKKRMRDISQRIFETFNDTLN